jgi:adenylate cyclase
MHDALRDLTSPILTKAAAASDYRPEVRVGIATGPVVTGLFAGGGARNYTAIGDTVNVASRLQGLCETGRILADEATCYQAQHIFEFDEKRLLDVKGRQQPVQARYVRGLTATRGSFRGFEGEQARLVGRQRELSRLTELWELASTGTMETCLIAGVPGIGKSRLVAEFISQTNGAAERLASGRCYPYAADHPWEPLNELLRDLYGIQSELPPAEAAFVVVRGTEGTWQPDEITALEMAFGGSVARTAGIEAGAVERTKLIGVAIRRALGNHRGEPRLLVMEDMHWADDTTIAFLRDLFSRQLDSAALMLLVSRPPLPGETSLRGLFDGSGATLELGPLSTDEARELIDELLGIHDLPDTLIRRIVDRSGGNPLFVEELIKSFIGMGVLLQREGAWSVDGDPALVGIPDSIESLLSTRVDSLPPSVRQTLQLASVVGMRFWEGVLSEALVGRPVDHDLAELETAGLIQAEPVSLRPGDREYTFDHQLQQEVAYKGILRGARSELHGKIAAWIEANLQGTPELDERVAFHYERSQTPERGLPFLRNALDDAQERGALADASDLVQRAIAVASDPKERSRLFALKENIADTGPLQEPAS